MSESVTPVVDPNRFTSLAAMRVTHTALLRQYRAQGSSRELLDAAARFLGQASATGAVLDSDDDRMAAQSLLDYWAAILTRADYPTTRAVLDDFDPALSPTLADALCPYVGLEAFSEQTQELYFGRRRVVDELIGYLRGRRFLAVVGPSGSGKSSVVHGGVIPALKNGVIAGSEAWRYYPALVPGGDPVGHLINTVMNGAPEGLPRPSDAAGIVATVDASGNQPGVFAVDQFEEVFTLCQDERRCQEFVDALLALTTSAKHPHIVIVTLRSDFESQVASIPPLQAAFERAYRIPALGAAELRDAIERPAELVGLRLEPGLVDRLIKDSLGEPAALPLLQFTLRQLWDRREGNRLTLEAYRELGGGRRALARVADQFYDNLIPEDQVTLKRILLRMIRPGTGLEVTSNRIRRDSLYRDEPRERVDRVLDRVLESRLVRETPGLQPGDETIEVAHEALVRNWPRLVEWIEEERVNLRRRLRLTAAAEQWRAHGKDPGGLLGGSLLTEALAYDDLNTLEAEFVAASRGEAERVAKHDEDVRRRELEQTRALAEEQQRRADLEAAAAVALRRSNVRLSRGAFIIFILLILAAVGWFSAVRKQRTVSALIKGQGVVVVSETSRPPSPTPPPPNPSDDGPITGSAGDASSPKGRGGQRGTVTPPKSVPSGSARPPSTDESKQTTVPAAELDFSGVEIRATSQPTGGTIPGTELQAYTFKVWVTGPADVMRLLDSVQYEFNHPTFTQKVITGRDRSSGFQVGYTGWGCLSAVTVTLVRRDRGPSPPHLDFDMCEAIRRAGAKKR